MITMRRQLLGLGFVAASSLLAFHAAQAMSGPTAIQIDGGPLGPLQLSGGVDGYGYFLSGTNSNGFAPGTKQSNGANIGSALIELQKTDGILQFTIEIGSNGGALTLGEPPISNSRIAQTSINNFVTGPLYAGYITIAPTGSPVTFSAGQLNSLEGYEAGIDWVNPVQLTTAIFFVQNSQARGVEAAYTHGPLTATVEFGDGFDSGVFNYLQGLATYTINSTNVANIYAAGSLGRTGPNTFAYGQGTTGLGNSFVNSNMIGAFYSWTKGNLNLVPEVQFQYAKTDFKAGIDGETTDFGAALFGDYSFGTSPYSIGAWGEYYTSHTAAASNFSEFAGPNAQGIGAAVAPTWQYKDLFARANAGYFYLLHNKDANGVKYGYGDNGDGRGQFIGTLEAGLLF